MAVTFKRQTIPLKRGKRTPGRLAKHDIITEDVEAMVCPEVGIAYHPIPPWTVLSRLVPEGAYLLSWVGHGYGSASSSLAVPMDEATVQAFIAAYVALPEGDSTPIYEFAEQVAARGQGNWFTREPDQSAFRNPFCFFTRLCCIIDAALEALDMPYRQVQEVEIEYLGEHIEIVPGFKRADRDIPPCQLRDHRFCVSIGETDVYINQRFGSYLAYHQEATRKG